MDSVGSLLLVLDCGWTFYIGPDGKITAIDKTVKPATSAEDMAARLKDLGTPTR